MADNFLPDNYQVPSSGGYLQLENGERRIRILSNPLMTWNIWENKKVTRIPYNKDSKPPVPTQTKDDNVKHAWNVIVFDYKTKSIMIYEIDKVSLLSTLEKLARDAEWGHPKQYDIKITKEGSGMSTEYSLLACPKAPPSAELIQAYTETPIDLNQLLVKDGNPFLANAGSKANTQTQQTAAKVVTPENWVAGDKIPDGYVVGSGGRLEANKLPF